MRKLIYLVIFLFISIGIYAQTKDLVQYVNTLQGTDSHFGLSYGNTYPTTGMPYAMHTWSAQTGKNGEGWKYQYAVDKTDPEVVYYKHQIAYTPRHSAGASLALENPFINASLHATGVSKRYIASENRPSNEMDGYIEYGLSLYRSFKIKKFTYNLRGDIINLGNKQYDIVKSYPMPGRSYKLTCSIHF